MVVAEIGALPLCVSLLQSSEEANRPIDTGYNEGTLWSSNIAGWKIPELNGGFNRRITDKWSIFQPAMFEYTRVGKICQDNSTHLHRPT